MLAIKAIRSDDAMQSELTNLRPRLGNVLGIGIQAVHKSGIGETEGCRKLAFAAVEMHDEAALELSFGKDLPSLLLLRFASVNGEAADEERGYDDQRAEEESSPVAELHGLSSLLGVEWQPYVQTGSV
jgi:hypothetical protein